MKFFHFILLILTYVSLFAQSIKAQVDAESFYLATGSGIDQLSITNQELALLSIGYFEKKLNNLYESAWEQEGFKSPEDFYVKVKRSQLSTDALLVQFSVKKEVLEFDEDLEIHKRLGFMITDYLTPKVKLDSTAWIKWLISVDKTYGDVKQRSDDPLVRKLRSSFGDGTGYVNLPIKDVKAFRESTGDFGKKARRIKARDYAAVFLEPIIDDMHQYYKSFLDFNALQVFKDAEIIMEKDKADLNLIVFRFILNRDAKEADRELTQHRDMATKLLEFVERKAEPIRTPWLRFRFEADTTGRIRDRVWLTF